jgi:hypothetical protein
MARDIVRAKPLMHHGRPTTPNQSFLSKCVLGPGGAKAIHVINRTDYQKGHVTKDIKIYAARFFREMKRLVLFMQIFQDYLSQSVRK